MFLKRLISGGFGGIAEWQSMWNDEVLPHLRGAQLIAGPGIRIDRRPAGTLIRVVSSGGAETVNGGGMILAAVVTMPTSGGGVGTVAPVGIGSGGEIIPTSGASIPVIFPDLDGYN